MELESSQSPLTSAKAMLFGRWQHHFRFCSGFPYAPLKAMVTKISKWFRIQDFFRITPKIESLVVCAISDIPSKFQKDPSITSWAILLTHRQTNRQTKSGKNITSLAEVINGSSAQYWVTSLHASRLTCALSSARVVSGAGGWLVQLMYTSLICCRPIYTLSLKNNQFLVITKWNFYWLW